MAFHFHWPLGEILDLEHPLRRAFAARARAIASGTAPGSNIPGTAGPGTVAPAGE